MAKSTTTSPALRTRKRGTTTVGLESPGNVLDPNHGTNNNNSIPFRGENNIKRKKKPYRDIVIVFVFFAILISISPTMTTLDLDPIHSSPQQIAAAAKTTTTTPMAKAKAETSQNVTKLSSQTPPQQAPAAKTLTRPKVADFDTLSKAGKCVRRIIQHADSVANKKNGKKQQNRRRQQQFSRKPILYIHPGPPKTATTTIQQLLTDHESDLNDNNIFLIGKTMPKEKYSCNFPNTPYCVVYLQHAEKANNPQNPDSNCTTIMRDQLDEYYSMGADVILTDEVIGAMFALQNTHKDYQRALDGLKEFFHSIVRKNDWEVRVLIGYRPYFDFVKSQFFQLHKAKKKDASKNKWAGRKALNEWPDKRTKGKHIPPLRNELFKRMWPFTDELVDVFQPYADQLDVFDITSPPSNLPVLRRQTDIAVRFFCDLLVDATTACRAQKERSVGVGSGNTTTIVVRENVAHSLDYDRIATAAYEKGMLAFASKMDRHSVTSRIRDYVEGGASSNFNKTTTTRAGENDLSLLCPSDERVSKLYNISLAHEMRLFPARKPHWETKELFETMMNEKKLCSVDANKVLEKDEWKMFFLLM